MSKCFALQACFCFKGFLEKWGIKPKFLDSHQFYSCCCTGFQTLLCFSMPKSRGHYRQLDYLPDRILTKIWNYYQDRNCLAHWQKSSFCSSTLHCLSNLAPGSFPSPACNTLFSSANERPWFFWINQSELTRFPTLSIP